MASYDFLSALMTAYLSSSWKVGILTLTLKCTSTNRSRAFGTYRLGLDQENMLSEQNFLIVTLHMARKGEGLKCKWRNGSSKPHGPVTLPERKR